jgi:hypothetical protein
MKTEKTFIRPYGKGSLGYAKSILLFAGATHSSAMKVTDQITVRKKKAVVAGHCFFHRNLR